MLVDNAVSRDNGEIEKGKILAIFLYLYISDVQKSASKHLSLFRSEKHLYVVKII